MKQIILLAVSLFGVTFGNAQLREKGTIELIPQIGYLSANYYGSEVGNNDPISNVTFGVGGDYFFSNRWSLRSGLLYQTMGTQFLNYEEKLNYLTIPVNANWHFGSTRKWNLNFGPSIGFLMSAEDNSGRDLKDLVNPTQIGLNYGIGYKIEVSEQFSILVDFQGMTGLTEVDKSGFFNFTNVASSFNVGGVFKL